MNDTNVRYTVMDEMEEAGIIKREGNTAMREFGGRQYFVSVVVFDVTGWEEDPR